MMRGCGGTAKAAVPNAARPRRDHRPAASETRNHDGCRDRSRPRRWRGRSSIRLFHFLDDLHRRVDIGFGAAEIELGPGLSRGEMRAVGLVGRQMRSVDRCRGFDAVRKMRRRVDGISAAHAVADGADPIRAGGRLSVGEAEQGAGIFHDQGNVDRVHQLEHALALGRFRIRRQRPELHDARSVIEVRQHHVIARCAEPARHVAQFLADRRRVHVKEDDGMRPAALGMGDEGGGVAVFGRDFDLLVDHGTLRLNSRSYGFLARDSVRLQGNQDMTRRPALWGTTAVLNSAVRIAIVLSDRPLRSRPEILR